MESETYNHLQFFWNPVASAMIPRERDEHYMRLALGAAENGKQLGCLLSYLAKLCYFAPPPFWGGKMAKLRLKKHFAFYQMLLCRVCQQWLQRGEVAVGCVLVHRSGEVLAVGHNETNQSRNGNLLIDVQGTFLSNVSLPQSPFPMKIGFRCFEVSLEPFRLHFPSFFF